MAPVNTDINKIVDDLQEELQQDTVCEKSLSKWVNKLQEMSHDNIKPQPFITCIFKYIDLIFMFGKDKDYYTQAIVARNYFEDIKDMVCSGLQKEFLSDGTQIVFNYVLEENTENWCIKKELLRFFNDVNSDCTRTFRHEIVNKLPEMYLFKLFDSITSCGDYELQAVILETIFRMYSQRIIYSNFKELLPESAELATLFSKINGVTFDQDIRRFLNAFNTKYDKISTIICTDILVDDTYSIPAEEEGFYVNFNLWHKTITWYQLHLDEDRYETWELITVFVSEVDWAYMTTRPEEPEKLVLQIKVDGPCLTSLPGHQEKRNKIKHIKIITRKSNIINENSYICMLQKIFGYKYYIPSQEKIKILRFDVVPADKSKVIQETQKLNSYQSDDYFSMDFVDPPPMTLNSHLLSEDISADDSRQFTSSKSISSILELSMECFSTADSHISENSRSPLITLRPLKIFSGRCSGSAVHHKKSIRSLEERRNETESLINLLRDRDIISESEEMQFDSNYFLPPSSPILPKVSTCKTNLVKANPLTSKENYFLLATIDDTQAAENVSNYRQKQFTLNAEENASKTKVSTALQEIKKSETSNQTQRFTTDNILGQVNEFYNEKDTKVKRTASALKEKNAKEKPTKTSVCNATQKRLSEFNKENQKIVPKVSTTVLQKIMPTNTKDKTAITTKDNIGHEKEIGKEQRKIKLNKNNINMVKKVSTALSVKTKRSKSRQLAIVLTTDSLERERKLNNAKEKQTFTSENASKMFRKVSTAISGKKQPSGSIQNAVLSIQDGIDHEQKLDSDKGEKYPINVSTMVEKISTDISGKIKLSSTKEKARMSSQDYLDYETVLDNDKKEQKCTGNTVEMTKKVSVASSKNIRTNDIEEKAISIQDDLEHEQELDMENQEQKDSVNDAELLQETAFSGQIKPRAIMSSHHDDLEYGNDLDKEKERKFSTHKAEIIKKVFTGISRKTKLSNKRQEAIIEIQDDLQPEQKLGDEKEIRNHTGHTLKMVQKVSTDISRKIRMTNIEKEEMRSIQDDLEHEQNHNQKKQKQKDSRKNEIRKHTELTPEMTKKVSTNISMQDDLEHEQELNQKKQKQKDSRRHEIRKYTEYKSEMTEKVSTNISRKIRTYAIEEEAIRSIQNHSEHKQEVHPKKHKQKDLQKKEIRKHTVHTPEMVQKESTDISRKISPSDLKEEAIRSIQDNLEREPELNQKKQKQKVSREKERRNYTEHKLQVVQKVSTNISRKIRKSDIEEKAIRSIQDDLEHEQELYQKKQKQKDSQQTEIQKHTVHTPEIVQKASTDISRKSDTEEEAIISIQDDLEYKQELAKEKQEQRDSEIQKHTEHTLETVKKVSTNIPRKIRTSDIEEVAIRSIQNDIEHEQDLNQKKQKDSRHHSKHTAQMIQKLSTNIFKKIRTSDREEHAIKSIQDDLEQEQELNQKKQKQQDSQKVEIAKHAENTPEMTKKVSTAISRKSDIEEKAKRSIQNYSEHEQKLTQIKQKQKDSRKNEIGKHTEHTPEMTKKVSTAISRKSDIEDEAKRSIQDDLEHEQKLTEKKQKQKDSRKNEIGKHTEHTPEMTKKVSTAISRKSDIEEEAVRSAQDDLEHEQERNQKKQKDSRKKEIRKHTEHTPEMTKKVSTAISRKSDKEEKARRSIQDYLEHEQKLTHIKQKQKDSRKNEIGKHAENTPEIAKKVSTAISKKSDIEEKAKRSIQDYLEHQQKLTQIKQKQKDSRKNEIGKHTEHTPEMTKKVSTAISRKSDIEEKAKRSTQEDLEHEQKLTQKKQKQKDSRKNEIGKHAENTPEMTKKVSTAISRKSDIEEKAKRSIQDYLEHEQKLTQIKQKQKDSRKNEIGKHTEHTPEMTKKVSTAISRKSDIEEKAKRSIQDNLEHEQKLTQKKQKQKDSRKNEIGKHTEHTLEMTKKVSTAISRKSDIEEKAKRSIQDDLEHQQKLTQKKQKQKDSRKNEIGKHTEHTPEITKKVSTAISRKSDIEEKAIISIEDNLEHKQELNQEKQKESRKKEIRKHTEHTPEMTKKVSTAISRKSDIEEKAKRSIQDDLEHEQKLTQKKQNQKDSQKVEIAKHAEHTPEITKKVSTAVSRKSDIEEKAIRSIQDNLEYEQELNHKKQKESRRKEIRKHTENTPEMTKKVSTDISRKIGKGGIEEEAVRSIQDDLEHEQERNQKKQKESRKKEIRIHTEHTPEMVQKASTDISRKIRTSGIEEEPIISIQDDLEHKQEIAKEKQEQKDSRKKERRNHTEHKLQVVQKACTDISRKIRTSDIEEEPITSIQDDLEHKQELAKEKQEQKDSQKKERRNHTEHKLQVVQKASTDISRKIRKSDIEEEAIISIQDDLEHKQELAKEKQEQKDSQKKERRNHTEHKLQVVQKASTDISRKIRTSDIEEEPIISIQDDLEHKQELAKEKQEQKDSQKKERRNHTEHKLQVVQKASTDISRKIRKSDIEEEAIISIQDDLEHKQELAKEKQEQKDSQKKERRNHTEHKLQVVQKASTDISRKIRKSDIEEEAIISIQDDLEYRQELAEEKQEQRDSRKKERRNHTEHKLQVVQKVSTNISRKIRKSDIDEKAIRSIQDDLEHEQELYQKKQEQRDSRKKERRKHTEHKLEMVQKVSTDISRRIGTSDIEEEAKISIHNDLEHEQKLAKEKQEQKDSVIAAELLQETVFAGQLEFSHVRERKIMSSHQGDLDYGKDLDREKEEQKSSAHKTEIPKKMTADISKKIKLTNRRQESLKEIEDDLLHEQNLDNEKEIRKHTRHALKMVQKVSTDISRKSSTTDIEEESIITIQDDLQHEQELDEIQEQKDLSQKMMSSHQDDLDYGEDMYKDKEEQQSSAHKPEMTKKVSAAVSRKIKPSDIEEEAIRSIQDNLEHEQELNTTIGQEAIIEILDDLQHEQKLDSERETRKYTENDFKLVQKVSNVNIRKPLPQLEVRFEKFDLSIYKKKTAEELTSVQTFIQNEKYPKYISETSSIDSTINLSENQETVQNQQNSEKDEVYDIDDVERALENMYQLLDSESSTVQKKKTSDDKISVERKEKSKGSSLSSATLQDSILEMSRTTDTSNTIIRRKRKLCNPNDITILPDQDDEVERRKRRLTKESLLSEELDLRRSDIIEKQAHSTPEKTKELSQSKCSIEEDANLDLDKVNLQKSNTSSIEHTPTNPVREDRESPNSLTKRHAEEHLLRSARREKTKKRTKDRSPFNADMITLHKKRRHERFAKINEDDRSMLNRSLHKIFGWPTDDRSFLKEVFSKTYVCDVSKDISSKSTLRNYSNADKSKSRDYVESSGVKKKLEKEFRRSPSIAKIDQFKKKKRIPNDQIRYADLHKGNNSVMQFLKDIEDDVNDGESLMEMLRARKMKKNIVNKSHLKNKSIRYKTKTSTHS
ncbi:uncharacterized protein [Diabrotica undecimpunctata]|uniref:uncharacterized protein n=1 Tax=Diabrotica undecimpunctata TaxID=50387 RepID=UPI003B63454A